MSKKENIITNDPIVRPQSGSQAAVLPVLQVRAHLRGDHQQQGGLRAGRDDRLQRGGGQPEQQEHEGSDNVKIQIKDIIVTLYRALFSIWWR